jgi:uncharacterized protein (TIGR03086 family)
MISCPLERLNLCEGAHVQRRRTVIDLKPAGNLIIEIVAGVADDQLDCSTPCTDYSVGDLVDHVDHLSRLFAALARHDQAGLRGVSAGPDPVQLDPEWRDVLSGHVRALVEAWDDPAAWQGTDNMPGSDLSNQVWGRITLTEVVVHAWDIAQATDQRFDLPEATLRACLDHVVEFVPKVPVQGLWGPPVEVGINATLVNRIVAVTGRVP